MSPDFMDSGMSLILLITTISLSVLWFSYRRKSAENLPPGPRGLPFIGALPSLIGRNQFAVFAEWARTYGDVVSFEVMGQKMVVLNEFNVVREALKKDSFSGRPHSFLNDVLAKNRGILGTDGDLWKVQRRFDLSVLRDFGMGKLKAEEAIQEELRRLIAAIEEKNGEPFNFHDIMQSAVCNIITSILFGKSYDYDDPKILQLIQLISENLANITDLNSSVSMAPWLRYLPGDFFKYWKTVDNANIIELGIQENIKDQKSTYNPDVTRNFVDAFLHRMKEEREDPNSTFTDVQLQKTCVELFIAGMETTSTTLRWSVVYLLNHPEIQRQVQTEIDREINGIQPSMKHRVNLPYVEATINETMRYCCLVPGALPHANLKEETLNGYRIPKRSVIIPNIAGIHFDPRLWEDPQKFEPRRFLDQNDHVVKKDFLIPFSIGKRVCLGESLARMELFVFFSGLMQTFTFLPEIEGKPPSMEPVNGFVFAPENFLVRAKKRF